MPRVSSCNICCSIPGYGELRLEHCVSDFSGTLSGDGRHTVFQGERPKSENRCQDDSRWVIITCGEELKAAAALQGEKVNAVGTRVEGSLNARSWV